MEVVIAGVVEAIAAAKKRYQQAAAAAVYQEASAVMAESLTECPVDSGRLRQSHYVAPPSDLDDPVAHAGYGADYGVMVHERDDMKHAAPTKAHFLSDPIARTTEGYGERVAKRIHNNFANGVAIGSAGGGYPKRPAT